MLSHEQIEERRIGLGGSDIGPVLGLSPWTSPLDIYNSKLGLVPDRDLSDIEAVHFGNVLEDTIAKEYARRTGSRVRRRNQRIVHPQHPWMAANIDRSVDGEKKVLECKNSSEWMSGSWGESGSDEVPDAYLVQVAWYMTILGYDRADLAALIGGNQLRIFHFERDFDLETLIFQRARAFWFDNVMAKVPPPPSCERDLETLYAIDDGSGFVASEEMEAKVHELAAAKLELNRMEEEVDALKFDIRAAMGSASILLSAFGGPLVTNKAPKESVVVDGKRLKTERPDVWGQYSKPKKNSRRFLIKI